MIATTQASTAPAGAQESPQQRKPQVSQLYPPDVRAALVAAAIRRDTVMIDQLTDALAARGLVRPRSADGRGQG